MNLGVKTVVSSGGRPNSEYQCEQKFEKSRGEAERPSDIKLIVEQEFEKASVYVESRSAIKLIAEQKCEKARVEVGRRSAIKLIGEQKKKMARIDAERRKSKASQAAIIRLIMIGIVIVMRFDWRRLQIVLLRMLQFRALNFQPESIIR